MNKQKQDLEEKCKQEFIETFEHCEKYGLDTKDIISSLGIGVCKQAKREERQRLIEEVIELIKKKYISKRKENDGSDESWNVRAAYYNFALDDIIKSLSLTKESK